MKNTLVRFLLLLLALVGATSASALSVSATATSCSGTGWGGPGNAGTSNNVYATLTHNSTAASNPLQCRGFGFAIPASATINGIVVTIERKSSSTASGGSLDATVQLMKNSAATGSNLATPTAYTLADVSEDHGSATQLWGNTWNPAEINSANFGVAYAVKKASAAAPSQTISVDVITVTVYYTPFVCAQPANTPAGLNLTCQCDTFERSGLQPSTIFNSNWVVSIGDSTGIAPRIVNPGYMRLTEATGSNSKAAAVPGIFPAAGNYFSVEFRNYAYGGNGADGVTVALSDYAIPAQPGSSGGSLGYAQKSGVPGFAGGWLGVALDEYGNYQNPTEGRVGGPGFVPQSVGVRGSGSGQSGYVFLKGTGNLTGVAPNRGIDNTGSPVASHGDFYQIVVDARANNGTGGPVYASVNRDMSGGGSAYSSLVPSFDVYAAAAAVGATQAAVPTNFQVSFSGGTGGSTNIHEIGAVRICAQTFFPPSGGTLGGFNTIDSSYSKSTVNALQGHIFTKLAGTNFALRVAALNSTNSAIEGTYAAAGTKNVTLQLIDDSAGTSCGASATACTNCSKPVVASQTLAFAPSDAGFKVSSNFNVTSAYSRLIARASDGTSTGCSVDAFAVRPLSFSAVSTTANNTALTGTPKFKAASDSFTITATTATSGYTGKPKTNAAAMKANTPGSGVPAWALGTLSSTAGFNAAVSSSATGTFTYSEVGHFKFLGYATTNTTSPRGIYDDTWTAVDQGAQNDCVSGSYANTIDANGKYGCLFGIVADTPLMGRFVPDHFAVTKSTVAPFSNGFTYMGQAALNLGYVLQARNGSDAVTTNYSQALGYAVTNPTLVAEDGAAAHAGCNLAPRINAVVPTPVWANGVYNYNYDVTNTNLLSNPSTFSRPATIGALSNANCAGTLAGAAGPFDALDIGIALNDTDAGAVITQPGSFNMNASTAPDCVAAGNCNAYRLGTTRMLYGRVKLSNAFGSERLPLSIPIDVQYWQGTTFVRNANDSATTFAVPTPDTLAANAIPPGTPGLYFYGTSPRNLLGSANTVAALTTATAVAGASALNFTAPGSSNPGWLDVILDTPAHLQGNWANCLGQTAPAATFANFPCARAVFGVSRSPLIYRRENY